MDQPPDTSTRGKAVAALGYALATVLVAAVLAGMQGLNSEIQSNTRLLERISLDVDRIADEARQDAERIARLEGIDEKGTR